MIYSPLHFWIVNNFNKCVDHIDITSSDRAWCGGCWQHLCTIRTAIELYHCWKFWRWWKVLAHELRAKSLLSFAVRTSWGQWVSCLQLCTCDSRAFDFCWHCSELLVADEELSFVPNRWPLSDERWDLIRRPIALENRVHEQELWLAMRMRKPGWGYWCLCSNWFRRLWLEVAPRAFRKCVPQSRLPVDSLLSLVLVWFHSLVAIPEIDAHEFVAIVVHTLQRTWVAT